MMVDEGIDFVLPWVDSSDPAWRASKASYVPDRGERDNDTGALRYRDTQTLKYALRSIERYCPWYRKIHLITAGHVPEWLDLSHPKIELVTHEELYFDPSHLPTFNSTSIEMNLANLRGVSESFVYLNDDFIVLQPMRPEDFFVDGLPVDFLIHGWIPRNWIYQALRDGSSWVKSLNNCLDLINSVAKPKDLDARSFLFHDSYKLTGKLSNFFLLYLWKKYFFISHWHNLQPYRLSIIQEVYERFKEPMMACSANRFRSDNDLTQYLYRYYHLATGNFFPRYHDDNYAARISGKEDVERIFDEMSKERYRFVSIYDNYPESESAEAVGRLTRYFENIFPEKASFER